MNRIVEPSTWAGFGIFAQTVAPFVPPPWQWALHLFTAVTGAAAVALREKAAG